jgi:predicted PurR-regulated permease PerM
VPPDRSNSPGKDCHQENSNPNFFQRQTLWKAITGVSITFIACLSVAAVVIIAKILGFLQPVLVPLAVAGILAYLLEPAVRWMRRMTLFGRRPSRIQAILIVFLAAMVSMLILGLSVMIPASRELGDLFEKRAEIIADAKNAYVEFQAKIALFEKKIGFNPGERPDHKPDKEEPAVDAQSKKPAAGTALPESPVPQKRDASPETSPGDVILSSKPESQIWNEFIQWLKSPETGQAVLNFLGNAVNGFFGALGYIIGFFLVPVYLFFFLKDAPKIRNQWSNYVPVRQSKFKDELVSLLGEVNGYLIAYFRGQVLVSMIDGAITGIILAFLGLDYAIVIGVSLAILGVIPFVGIIITAIPAMLIAASQTNGPAVMVVALVFIAVQQIDGLLIQPKIIGNSVGLHPLTVIFSVLFWSLLIGGILGALLAVPLSAAVKVLFRRYIWEQKIHPNAVDGHDPPALEPDLQKT